MTILFARVLDNGNVPIMPYNNQEHEKDPKNSTLKGN